MHPKKILLFSSPRSGSTMLANILRSHPGLAFYNEIFTRAPRLLPRFEQAFQSGQVDLLTPFERDFHRLERYQLGDWIHRARWSKFLVFGSVKILASLNRRLRGAETWDLLHRIYHIHSLHEPLIRPFWETQFPKRSPDTLLIKDVRPDKAVRAMLRMYPDTRFVFLIRNPYFVVRSIIKQRAIQHLRDLSAIDRDYLHQRFRSELIDRFFDAGVEQRLALLWRLEQEDAYRDLRDAKANTLVVCYESLVRDQDRAVAALFEKLGLNTHASTKRYLSMIWQQTTPQAHLRSVFVHRDQLNRRTDESQLSSEFKAKIEPVLEGCKLAELHKSRDAIPGLAVI